MSHSKKDGPRRQILQKGGKILKEDEKGNWFCALLHSLRLAALALAAGALFLSLGPRAAACGPAAEAGWFFHREEKTALPASLIPVGHTVGIKLFSDGVLVVGLAQVEGETGTVAPAKSCGLREGDIITHINSQEVDTIEEVQSILRDVSGEKMSIRALRGDTPLQVTAQAAWCPDDGSYKLGAWIRDSMAGIGTVTFYDPATGSFGALGHGVSDVDTAKLMPLASGAILRSTVTGVQRGQAGTPGQLRGSFDTACELGELSANTESGVFGKLSEADALITGEPVSVAARQEVETGPAVIRSNIQGDEVCEYTVEISRIYPAGSNGTRDMLIRVTDPALLEATGGIVQGMSGSPILQNGKLVGAVTHVLVNDPTQGYGILIENMLDHGGEC